MLLWEPAVLGSDTTRARRCSFDRSCSGGGAATGGGWALGSIKWVTQRLQQSAVPDWMGSLSSNWATLEWVMEWVIQGLQHGRDVGESTPQGQVPSAWLIAEGLRATGGLSSEGCYRLRNLERQQTPKTGYHTGLSRCFALAGCQGQ